MLTLSQLRKIDPALTHISDEDLEAIRSELYQIARLAFDFKYREVDSKNLIGLLAPEPVMPKIES